MCRLGPSPARDSHGVAKKEILLEVKREKETKCTERATEISESSLEVVSRKNTFFFASREILIRRKGVHARYQNIWTKKGAETRRIPDKNWSASTQRGKISTKSYQQQTSLSASSSLSYMRPLRSSISSPSTPLRKLVWGLKPHNDGAAFRGVLSPNVGRSVSPLLLLNFGLSVLSRIRA